MTKLTRNAFLAANPNPYSLIFHFPDYKPGIIEHATGKLLPSPNQTTSTLLKNTLNVDYAIISQPGSGGKIQNILIGDQAAAQQLITSLKAIVGRPPAPHPYKAQAGKTLDLRSHVALAKNLGIM